MYFQSVQEFIEMDGHGIYVWLCYGIVLFALLGYFVYSKGLVSRNQKALVKFYKRMDARKQNASDNNASEINQSEINQSEINQSETNQPDISATTRTVTNMVEEK